MSASNRPAIWVPIRRYGFRAARMVWHFTQPHHAGALVMLWHGDKVLLVHTSYQEVWTAPGGGIEANETPVEAAVREVAEEVGLRLKLEDLRLALVTEHLWCNCHDRVHVFEVQMAKRPKLTLDNRELVEARFVTLAEAQSLDLAPHLQEYFRLKAVWGASYERATSAAQLSSTSVPPHAALNAGRAMQRAR